MSIQPAAFSGFRDPRTARVVCRVGDNTPDVALPGLVTRAFLSSVFGEPSTGSANADFSIPMEARFFRHTGTLTAPRALSFNLTNAVAGDWTLVTRTGSGAFPLNVGPGPLKGLAVNTWGFFVFNGTSAYLAAYGSL